MAAILSLSNFALNFRDRENLNDPGNMPFMTLAFLRPNGNTTRIESVLLEEEAIQAMIDAGKELAKHQRKAAKVKAKKEAEAAKEAPKKKSKAAL